MDMPAKMKAIRSKEGLTQGEFCQLLGFSLSTWKKYEAGITEMALAPFLAVANHARFTKYALWLTTGETSAACGQISPV
ncbi:helix-turn-helix domain-containing protein [Pseudomonas sp. COR18]|uniref:helix-turn-helix domain-containing protein n=1 Tax=Pseudomonas sp. COR18 TaxID=3399680 RepID=UPI003B008E78